jgi:PAS domain-containing protein
MNVVCAYCQLHIREKEPLADESISHGICEPCEQHLRQQLDGLSLGGYLDGFRFPILALDPDGRIIAANQLMAEMLGKSNRELAGLLGGDAFECQYARLPGGCGKTEHCKTCTIRRVVTYTAETGVPIYRRPVWVDRQDGRLEVLISSIQTVDGVVKVVIDKVED